MKEFYIADDGIQLHAKLDMPEEKEKCPLVIVFHGLTGNMEERHITAVSSAMNEIGFATLRVELYGHGKSGGTFEQHNLMKWINNAMTVTDYAKTLDFVTDLYICGHSQGGLLTMLAAGMRADDFKAAIPMSPAIVIPDGARKGNLLGQPFDPEHIPDMVEWGDRHLSGNYLRTAQLLDVDEAIRKYEKPVLLIHGDADEAVPIEYSIDAAQMDEVLGYYGEEIVLKIQELGLNSCWVAVTHGKSKADICKDEKELCLIAFGHGETQGVPHKDKPLQAVCNYTENMPEWFLNGVEAALLAPTAMNQQKFFFELSSDGTVNASCGRGFYTKLDFGIVKYHFEMGSGRKV